MEPPKKTVETIAHLFESALHWIVGGYRRLVNDCAEKMDMLRRTDDRERLAVSRNPITFADATPVLLAAEDVGATKLQAGRISGPEAVGDIV